MNEPGPQLSRAARPVAHRRSAEVRLQLLGLQVEGIDDVTARELLDRDRAVLADWRRGSRGPRRKGWDPPGGQGPWAAPRRGDAPLPAPTPTPPTVTDSGDDEPRTEGSSNGHAVEVQSA